MTTARHVHGYLVTHVPVRRALLVALLATLAGTATPGVVSGVMYLAALAAATLNLVADATRAERRTRARIRALVLRTLVERAEGLDLLAICRATVVRVGRVVEALDDLERVGLVAQDRRRDEDHQLLVVRYVATPTGYEAIRAGYAGV